MKIITVKTGFGYFVDNNGRIVSLAELPKGNHPCLDEIDYIDVADAQALSQVDVYIDPAVVIQQEYNAKIEKKMRTMAIAQLKTNGELPANYKEN